jgi:hypothetical protein
MRYMEGGTLIGDGRSVPFARIPRYRSYANTRLRRPVLECSDIVRYLHDVVERYAGRLIELSDWPKFQWDEGRLTTPLAAARHLQGRLVGQMEALGFKVREEAVLRTLTEDVLKSSEIEGEKLDADQVPRQSHAGSESTSAGCSRRIATSTVSWR